jgi:hypothetical protein
VVDVPTTRVAGGPGPRRDSGRSTSDDRRGRRRDDRRARHGGRHRRRRPRHLGRYLAAALFLVAGAGAVLAATAWRDLRVARADLEAARGTLDQISADPSSLPTAAGRATAEQQTATAQTEVSDARNILHGSAGLRVAGFLPVLHAQRQGLLRLVDDSATATATGQGLLRDLDALAAQLQLRSGGVPLGALGTLQQDTQAAAATLNGLQRSPKGLWGSLADARTAFNTADTNLAARLSSGASDLGAARTFLGASGTRTYLLALENNAEMRDQGMVLDYATVTAQAGHLTFANGGSITGLALKAPAPVPIPATTQSYFGYMRLTQLWQSVNTSADFSFSGQAMVDMYRAKTGRSIDGVIAVDVPGLAALLQVIGPVEIPEFSENVTAANAGTLLLHDLYSQDPTPDQAPRHEGVVDVASGVMDRLTHGQFDAVALGRSLATAADGGHIRLYSTQGAEENVFELTGLGGSPAAVDADRTFHLAVESRLATKVDYYINAAAAQRIVLTNDGTAIIRTTVTVDNTAPKGATPSYQLGPDQAWKAYAPTPGDYIAWTLLWGPAGSTQIDSVPESGLRVTQAAPLVHAGQDVTVTFDTIIPNAVVNGQLLLRYVPQPRLNPDTLAVTLDAPGWLVSGAATWQGSWDQTRTLTWDVHRR